MTPAAEILSPDRGRRPGGGGSGGGGGVVITNPTPASTAITPTELRGAYGLTTTNTGSGMTIAIVDAYNDPNIVSDLATYDSTFKLPTASLSVVNQNGSSSSLPYTDPNWSLEIAMDVELAHAAAPGANIVLVEANSASVTDLMTAVQTAARMANVVSMSWGGAEWSGQTMYDTAAYFANPKVTFVAASGDDGGVAGAEWPASSPYVVGVGGTTLSVTTSGTYQGETAWSASGSWWSGTSGSTGGVSTVESLPTYQSTALGSSYAKGRVTPDVSLNANPSTGFAVYDSVQGIGQTGWFQVGGTSAGSPVWAAIIATADAGRSKSQGTLSSSQTLGLLYSLYKTSYASAFHDITSGSNFAGSAKTGYDMVTGLGSPIGSAIESAALTYGVGSSTSRSAALVVAPTTTTTTTHKAAVVFAQPDATAVAPVTTTTSAVIFALPVDPTKATVTTTATPGASASTTTSPTTNLPSPPVQPVSEGSTSYAAHSSSADDVVVIPPSPTNPERPGLFLDPVEPQEVGVQAPALAGMPTQVDPQWGQAVDAVFDGGSTLTPDATPTPPPVTVPEIDRTAATQSIALGSLAAAIWGAWKLRSEPAERDRRHWMLLNRSTN